MADVFVRRTTGFLLFLVFILSIVCVALIALLAGRSGSQGSPEQALAKEKGTTNSKESHHFASHAMVQTAVVDPTTETNSKMEPWEKNIRIPTTTLPYHYDLLLHPNLETESFSGEVAILIGVTSPMSYLLVHIKKMNVTSTELRDSSGMKYELRDAFEYKPNEFWVVRPVKSLMTGNYTLSIKFNGSLRGHITGFYMSEYTTKTGEKRAIATSKFQPTDARRAFPCFDEPSFKSTFKTTLVRPSQGYIALSNMPVEREIADSPSSGLTKVEFEKSVPMVTYLACFIVCDFDHVEVMTRDLKPFRVYATKDQIDRAIYAKDIGVNILNYFETYFEVKYPLPKQDMIAIPDFSSGAMEHWGLITYRETNLLYDAVNSSSYNKQRVAAVISHELAHMWFGNLVTLEWWDDLWLNEGFASYIEYKGVANYEKDWDMLDQFLSSDLHSVFQLDQILNSHPIVQTVNHPNEITEIFDKISYSKGASVLRMLEDFIGAETFRIGVRNFLRRFEYRNAVTQDLWDDLQKVSSSDLNITRIMDTWTRQMGFPVLNVKTSIGNKNKLEVRQQRFLVDAGAQSLDDSPYGYKWDIPVTVMTKNLKREQVWFKMEDEKIMLDRPIGSNWIKLNVDQYGYYRVNYDDGLWTELINALRNNHEMLSPSDRANLIDDSFSLAAAGQISYDVAFQTISYLPRETHFVPWSATHQHLQDLGGLLRNTKAYTFFRKYVVQLVDKHVDRIRWQDSGTHTERRNRENILNLACSNGHQKCLEGAVTKFKDWIRDPQMNAIPANLRSIIYIYGIKETGEAEWDELLNRYVKEINAQEKTKMLRGLASTKESWVANRLIDLGRNETIVRRQDFLTMLYYLTANPSTISDAWSFIRGNWEWLIEEFGLDSRYLGRVVSQTGYQFTSTVELEEIEAFFTKYPDAGAGKRARQQALEKIRQNIKWLESNAEPLHMWLKKNTV